MMDASRTVADVAFPYAQGWIPLPSGSVTAAVSLHLRHIGPWLVAGYKTIGEATSTRLLPTSQRTDSSTVSPAVCCGS